MIYQSQSNDCCDYQMIGLTKVNYLVSVCSSQHNSDTLCIRWQMVQPVLSGIPA